MTLRELYINHKELLENLTNAAATSSINIDDTADKTIFDETQIMAESICFMLCAITRGKKDIIHIRIPREMDKFSSPYEQDCRIDYNNLSYNPQFPRYYYYETTFKNMRGAGSCSNKVKDEGKERPYSYDWEGNHKESWRASKMGEEPEELRKYIYKELLKYFLSLNNPNDSTKSYTEKSKLDFSWYPRFRKMKEDPTRLQKCIRFAARKFPAFITEYFKQYL